MLFIPMSLLLLMFSAGRLFASDKVENDAFQTKKINPGQDFAYLDLVEDVRKLVVTQTSLAQCLENWSPVYLALVCSEWRGDY